MTASARRVILDVSSLVRWVGPPVGIVRVVHALATALRTSPPDRLVAYDRKCGEYRYLASHWTDTLLGWSGLVDRHIPQKFPRNLASRSGLVSALERIRLTTSSASWARWAGRLQRPILALRPHQFPLQDKDGNRIANVPTDLAFGAVARFRPNDTLLLPGMGWSDLDTDCLRAIKTASGCRIATICYDLIPITHPHFYTPEDRRSFGVYWRAMLPLLDHWVLSAQAIQNDLIRWCQTLNVPPPPSAIVDFGYDPPPPNRPAPLPEGLTPGKFALFVSTIEPRKGHAILLDAWQFLLDRGLPQDQNFHLVFVGRPGWMVDDVLRRLATPPWGIVHLPNCSDDALASLYQHTAFCCYPSEYEGYGLPPIEAFARGKAVLSSSGGALRETAGPFAPILDPLDAAAWAEAMADWIEHPEHVAEREQTIAAGFHHPDWPAAAAAIFDVVSQSAIGDFRRAPYRTLPQ